MVFNRQSGALYQLSHTPPHLHCVICLFALLCCPEMGMFPIGNWGRLIPPGKPAQLRQSRATQP